MYIIWSNFGKIKKLLLFYMFKSHWAAFSVLATILKGSDSRVKTKKKIKSLFL